MRILLLILFLINGINQLSAQNDLMARNFFDRGEFEKAQIEYETLLSKSPSNFQYMQNLASCYQQLNLFDKSFLLLEEYYKKYKQPQVLVEMGFDFQLQKDEKKAHSYYEKALEKVRENGSNAYGIGATFEKKALLEWALKAYKEAVIRDPSLNFNYQTAQIYGQMGQMEKMIETFLNEAEARPVSTNNIQTYLVRFINEDTGDHFSNLLRKSLLLRAQKNQDTYWNQFLSWFFVQRQEYAKAFVQEKAIYKRNPESFSNIVNLAQLIIEEGEPETAEEILNFILENTQDLDLQMTAHRYLMQIQIDKNLPENNEKILQELNTLIKKYGITPYSIDIQIQRAHFLAFYMGQSEEAIKAIQAAIELPLNTFQTTELKMLWADIMLYDEKFNQALLFYAQIEESLKNDPIGHEASFKVAQTTYFKGDFEWALTQLKVLKSSDTQLIANDALELFLIINDYTEEDSTQTALRGLARADYLLYKNKPREAKELLNSLIKNHPEEAIQEVILLRLGNTSEKLNEFDQALVFYQKIIDEHPESIYKDEALYFSGNIYWKEFEKPDEAKKCFEIMLLNHQDSIYYIEARKKLRLIRGDTNI
jgi:tetratricopeptide (TPR) repeat protein